MSVPAPPRFTAPVADFAARVRDSFARQPAMHLIGAAVSAIEPGYCEVTLPVTEKVTQQHGFVHGGITGMIADSAAGYAAFSLMPADASPLTVEYKINMLNPAHGDALVARARVVKAGRTLVITQGDVFAVRDGAEQLCATMQQTLIVMRGVPDTRRA
ncbi:MAG: PaaI family thioesterase [Burkholderiales bacterium]|nr:PaaI family thioesterase [Burkholderiales bacterium]